MTPRTQNPRAVAVSRAAGPRHVSPISSPGATFLRYWRGPLEFVTDLIGAACLVTILVGGQAIAWVLQ